MKFVLVPLLMLLILSQSFSKLFVVLEYNLNKDFIAKNLCINKAKPKLHCNGKCQMMKKLAEEEKQNSPNNSTTKIKIQEVLFSNEMNTTTLPVIACITLSYNEDRPLVKLNSPVSPIFHPPAFA
jgi:hypothetical protein